MRQQKYVVFFVYSMCGFSTRFIVIHQKKITYLRQWIVTQTNNDYANEWMMKKSHRFSFIFFILFFPYSFARLKIDDVFVLRLIWVQIYVYEKYFFFSSCTHLPWIDWLIVHRVDAVPCLAMAKKDKNTSDGKISEYASPLFFVWWT